jgi:hypothetical protein
VGAEPTFFCGNPEDLKFLIDRCRKRSKFWACIDADPENASRSCRRKESIAFEPGRYCLSRHCRKFPFYFLDFLVGPLTDELERNVKGFLLHPASVWSKFTQPVREASNTLPNVIVDIKSYEESHK